MYTAFAPARIRCCNVQCLQDTKAPPHGGGEVLRILRALRKGPVAGALPQRKRPRLNGCGEGPAISGSPTWRYAATAGSKDASPPCRSPAPQGRAGKSPPDPSRPFAMTSAHQACRVRHPSAGQPVRFFPWRYPALAGGRWGVSAEYLTRRREATKRARRRRSRSLSRRSVCRAGGRMNSACGARQHLRGFVALCDPERLGCPPPQLSSSIE
jgi:hypothetical protein